MRPAMLGAILFVIALLLAAGWFFLGPELFEPEVVHYWPLTGEVAPDGDTVRTRIVSVKIDNSSAARPQAGLADADVVYETLAEGGIPRLNALFHSALPLRVGPVRSARFSDAYLVPQYEALFAYSGASSAVRERITAAGIDDLGMERRPALYDRDPGRAAPHNVFASVVEIQAAAAGEDFATAVEPRPLLFGEIPETLPEAPAATRVAVPFAGGSDVLWTWDEEVQRWMRAVGGQPHADEGTAEPYSAANVVVMYAEAAETGFRDAAGAVVLDIQLLGAGDAVVLRDGRRYDVRWTSIPEMPPRFEAADGTEFPLAVGRTWIQVLPPGYDVIIE